MQQFAVSTEAIDFQRDGFGKELEAIFAEMMKFVDDNIDHVEDIDIHLGKDDTYQGSILNLPLALRFNVGKIKALRELVATADFKTRLSLIIEKRFGFKTKFIFNTNCPAAVMPFLGDNNHILARQKSFSLLIAEQTLDAQHDELAKEKALHGTVDLKRAKVGGIFSVYTHQVYFDFVVNHLDKKLTPAEMAGVLLHELGHVFTFYEFSDRMESTNQVLAHVAKKTVGMDDDKARVYALTELGAILDISQSEIGELKEEKDMRSFGMKIVKLFMRSLRSQMPNSKYDDTASEQLADNFAARFGYGRHVIMGLDKIMPNFLNFERNTFMMCVGLVLDLYFVVYSNIKKLLYCLRAVSVIGSMTAGPIFFLCVDLFFTGKELFFSGDAHRNMTYDDLKTRYKRLRDQLIEMINQLDLSHQELKAVVDDIHFMDRIIDHTYNYRKVTNRVANFLFSKSRDIRTNIELQQLLEELTHNNLFLKSAELKLLS